MSAMSRIVAAVQALEKARPVLRDLLRSDVECVATFREGEPALSELSVVDRAWLEPTLEAVQAVEGVIGRAAEEPHRKVEWLDALIDKGLPS